MQITEVKLTINGVAKFYADKCPASLTTNEFLKRLEHNVLYTASSLRVVSVPGLSEQIDKADVSSVTVTTTR